METIEPAGPVGRPAGFVGRYRKNNRSVGGLLRRGKGLTVKQRTLSIIKPDAVSQNMAGRIIARLEAEGLQIRAMKMLHLSRKEAEGFYAVHRERPFFGSLTDFMSSGPVVVMVLEGDDAIARYRTLMGATDPAQAAAGTLRAEFATDKEKNAVHGSDAPETAAFEIGYFFSALEQIN